MAAIEADCYISLVQESNRVNPAERVAQLRQEIEDHNYRYHVRDDPIISDREFDHLYRELVELEKEHPDLVSSDSPTQRVGAEPQERFRKVAHGEPMLSLANAFDEDELQAFYRRVTKLLDMEEIRLVTELKIDGVAVSLTYENGRLHHGATRGNGVEGEEVTSNLRTIRSLPLRLREGLHPSTAEIRGEIYFPLSGFERVNRQRSEEGEAPFANPRNAAAGALRQLDPAVTATRPLAFFAYSLGHTEGLEFTSQRKVLEQLDRWGFPVNRHHRSHAGLSSVIEYCQSWEERRDSIDYEVDGVVVKVDRLDLQDRLGAVSREPRWAVAYKFKSQVAATRLRRDQAQRGPDRGSQSLCDPGAGGVGRSHHSDRHASQPGGHPEEGHPPRRPGCHQAGGRRHSPGGGAGGQRRGGPGGTLFLSRRMSGMRHSHRPGSGRGPGLLPQRKLSRPAVRVAQALRQPGGAGYPGPGSEDAPQAAGSGTGGRSG